MTGNGPNLSTLEKTITKDILKSELYAGGRPAAELLYARYSGMLYSYILQFVPDRTQAGALLVDIFSRLTARLQEALDSHLSIYCWLQVESRKMLMQYVESNGIEPKGRAGRTTGSPAEGPSFTGFATGASLSESPKARTFYFSLLEDAPPEHQWVFREVFLYGKSKEDLALQSGKDLAYVSRILRECLGMISKNLGG
jgi:hypothetical protein